MAALAATTSNTATRQDQIIQVVWAPPLSEPFWTQARSHLQGGVSTDGVKYSFAIHPQIQLIPATKTTEESMKGKIYHLISLRVDGPFGHSHFIKILQVGKNIYEPIQPKTWLRGLWRYQFAIQAFWVVWKLGSSLSKFSTSDFLSFRFLACCVVHSGSLRCPPRLGCHISLAPQQSRLKSSSQNMH